MKLVLAVSTQLLSKDSDLNVCEVARKESVGSPRRDWPDGPSNRVHRQLGLGAPWLAAEGKTDPTSASTLTPGLMEAEACRRSLVPRPDWLGCSEENTA